MSLDPGPDPRLVVAVTLGLWLALALGIVASGSALHALLGR